MKINFERLKEINMSCVHNNDVLSCYWLIQTSTERFLSENDGTINDKQKEFLLELGVLEYTQEESKKIVEPFNFMGNDRSKNN